MQADTGLPNFTSYWPLAAKLIENQLRNRTQAQGKPPMQSLLLSCYVAQLIYISKLNGQNLTHIFQEDMRLTWIRLTGREGKSSVTGHPTLLVPSHDVITS